MGWACGKKGQEEKCIQDFEAETWEKETTYVYNIHLHTNFSHPFLQLSRDDSVAGFKRKVKAW
jgi:hypothetical protein